MAYAVGGHDPVLWLPGHDLPVFITDPDRFELHAWNSFFEWCVIRAQFKKVIPLNQWHDTAAMAAALALPRALGACSDALGLSSDEAKSKRGKYLIQRLSKPQRGKRNRDPELLAEFYDYCKQDVVAERAIANKLIPLTDTERSVWLLDQQINARGVAIDTAAVDCALSVVDYTTDKLNQEVSEITSGHLTNVSQRARVMDYIRDAHGYELTSFTKGYLESVLSDEPLTSTARRIIEIRLQLGKTSTAKYAALKALVTEDNRAHGLLMYHGASTGRWSGRHFQPQNLPRPTLGDTDTAVDVLKLDDPELIEAIYDEPMEVLSSCLRGMLCAPVGKQLVVADYSAIEARVLPWLAGQADVLEVFRGHGKIYEHTASQIYRCKLEDVDKEQRFIGKVATLALGYQGGAKAFTGMAENYGVEISTDLAEQVKTDWRSANAHIVKFWYVIDTCAIEAVKQPGTVQEYRGIKFKVVGSYLFCRLPSGRRLAYFRPQIGEGRFGGDQVTFMGTNSVTRKWERQSTYGGKLTENITQAVARDIMAEAMLRIDAAGFEIVLSVHDELLAEVTPDRPEALKEFEALMCELPSWAKGLPIDSEGFICTRYRK